MKLKYAVYGALLLSVNGFAAVGQHFVIEGHVGNNMDSNRVQIVTANGKTVFYPRSVFKADEDLRPGKPVKLELSIDELTDFLTVGVK